MITDKGNFELDDDALSLRAYAVPWDSDIFGFPVAAISAVEIKKSLFAQSHFEYFKAWVYENSYVIVSCRLLHHQLVESMFLERNEFRFVEMVLHPIVPALQGYPIISTEMVVEQVCEAELPDLVSMAERSFGYERYHVDPRLDSKLADIRYGHWVRNSHPESKQRLLKVRAIDGNTVAFFVVENKDDHSVHWHLTAVNPDFQGKGLGYHIWMTMINYHKLAGVESIRTTISARNVPVLNLYSKLNFRFAPPEMTFHWVMSDQ